MYLPVHYLDGDYTTPYNYSTWLISAINYSCTCPYQPSTLGGVLLPTTGVLLPTMKDSMAYCHTSTVAAEADHLFLQNAGQGEKGDSRLSLTLHLY
jgi:hypothetical protein